MGRLFKQISLVPKPLRYKLMISFALMSIIPLLICVYLTTNFIFPNYQESFDMGTISLIIFITIIITILGLFLAKGMIEPIVQMALDAKRIAEGDLDHSVRINTEDEIGDLGKSLNIMTQRIKDNIAELRNYGERTKEINIEINKKVLALSGLLQIGSLISTGIELQTVINMLVDKISQIEDSNPTVMFVVNEETDTIDPIAYSNFKIVDNVKSPVLLKHSVLNKVIKDMHEIIIDSNLKESSDEIEKLRERYEVKNFLAMPIVVHKKCKGLLLTGSRKDTHIYTNDDLELLRVFVKQAAIALENDALIKRAEELEVMDELTGLYNDSYLKQRLEEEIKRSIIYQRPCSFILIKMENFPDYCSKFGRMSGESALKKIAKSLSSLLTPVDKAARFSDDEFAVLLPERNKKEADNISREIIKKITETESELRSVSGESSLGTAVGISENPIDGASAQELISKAREYLSASTRKA